MALSSSKKRPLDEDALDSPRLAPRLRATAITSSSPLFAPTQAAAQMEIEALQAELQHERSLRSLEARRAQQLRQKLEQRLELATEQAKESKMLLEETQQESEAHMRQLRDARKDALQQLRRIQKASIESEANAQITERQAQISKENQRLMESQLSAMTQEVESLRRELEQRATLLQETEENRAPQHILEQPAGGSLAPTAVLKELNRTRLLLAESERKHRQLRRKSDEWHEKSKQYVQLKEASRIASSRIVQLETQLRNETKEMEGLRAENCSWNGFSKRLHRALGKWDTQSPTVQAPTDATAGLPPETARVLRLLEQWEEEKHLLRQDIKNLQTDLESSRASVVSVQQELKTSNAKLVASKQQLHQAESRLEKSEFDVQVMRAQEGIWKREADSLGHLLKTYNDEAALSKKKKPDAAVATMELSLSNAQDEIRLLTKERSRLSSQLETLETQQSELKSQHDGVVEKYGRLKRAFDEEKLNSQMAEERACKAESLAGKGHFNADETRVLHLKQNPVTEAMKQRYEQEIAALNMRLQEVTGDNSAKASHSAKTSPEVDPQKLHKRLKESFKEQIGLFREGVYLMTGFKVDMLPKADRPTFRVRSVYAERESDELVFVWPKSSSSSTATEGAPSSLDLMETEHAKLLATTDSYAYMTKFNSLPAFLASVQLRLFEKQTLA